jgi:hypothetical protein
MDMERIDDITLLELFRQGDRDAQFPNMHRQ